MHLAADIYAQRFRLGETESPGPFVYLERKLKRLADAPVPRSHALILGKTAKQGTRGSPRVSFMK